MWEDAFVNVNNVKLHCVTQGEGRLVVLLHGFPEFWYSWRRQIPVLAKHFKVVAPDMRGYNLSDKPSGVENYRIDLLVKDVVGLIEHFGEGKAFVVGHDWGGVVAWTLAATRPDVVEKLVVMNAPHPSVWQKKAKTSVRQLQKSWYIFFFQLAEVPERFLSKNNYLFLRETLRRTAVNAKTFTDEDIEEYVKAWSQPGALTAMINYYRANIRPEVFMEDIELEMPKIKAPTLVLWGEDDFALTREVSEGTEDYIDAPFAIKYLPCGHWIQNEMPETVNKHLRKFLLKS
ncbi:MAG: alpha/beta hydrolase [Candidatus Jordarchaeales archaeon]